MDKMNLNSFGVQEMTQQELLAVEGGNIFKKAWNGIKAAGEWVGNAAVDAWEWCKKHGHTETNSPGVTLPM